VARIEIEGGSTAWSLMIIKGLTQGPVAHGKTQTLKTNKPEVVSGTLKELDWRPHWTS
jgi:hypothetical protein